MLKVLFLAMEYPPMIGGGGTYVKNLLSSLINFPIEIMLLTVGEKDETTQVCDNLIVKRSSILKNLYIWEGNLLQGIDVVISSIREFGPDLIHSQHSMDAMLTQIVLSRFALSQVITNHRTPEHRDITTVTKGKTCMYDFVHAGITDYYVASSKVFKKALLESIEPLNGKDVRLVYPGIDRSFFRRASDNEIQEFRKELKIENNERLILLPMRIRRRKGLKFAARALGKIRFNGSPVKVIISGLPSDEEEKQLYAEAQALFKDNEFVRHRHFTDDDMPLLYSSVDITFLPSEAEGLGISLLEAMSCGCPVIGVDTLGINEVIDNSKNGYLVPYGDDEALEQKVLELLGSSEIRNAFVEQGFKTLEKKFDLRQQGLQHYMLYSEILKNHRVRLLSIIYTLVDNDIFFCIDSQSEEIFLANDAPSMKKTIVENCLDDIKRAGIVFDFRNPCMKLRSNRNGFYKEYRMVFEVPHKLELPSRFSWISSKKLMSTLQGEDSAYLNLIEELASLILNHCMIKYE